MDRETVIERLRKELDIPLFNGHLKNESYSEEEYQKLKTELLNYFEEYVRNVEN